MQRFSLSLALGAFFTLLTPAWSFALEVRVVPPTVEVAPGGFTTLAATVVEGSNPRWQWRWNGIPIPGQTGAELNVSNQFQNVGEYDVVAECDNGIALSKPVHVEVKPGWEDQVVLRYRFDQPATTGTVVDATGRTSGTFDLGKAKQALLPSLLSGSQGTPVASGWNFAGATGHLVIPPSAGLASLGDPKQGSGLTLGFWVQIPPGQRPKGGKLGGQLQSDAALAGMNQLLYLVATGDGGVYGQFGIDYYSPFAAFTTKPLDDGAWHHVIFTCDYRNQMSWIYVDGVRQKLGPEGKADAIRVSTNKMAAPGPVTGQALHIGADGNGKKPWKGGIAEFAFLTKPVQDAEALSWFRGTGAKGDAKNPLFEKPSPMVRIVPPRVVQLPAGSDTVTVPIRAIGIDVSGSVNYQWRNGYHMSKEMMTISQDREQTAMVTLHGAGDFGITCEATNGAKQRDTDYATIRVQPDRSPTIGAIECDTTALAPGAPQTVTLKAMVNDDRMPNPPALTTLEWSQVGGPKKVKLAKPWLAKTEVTIPGVAGDYRFRLKASDGAQTATSEVTVTVGGAAGLGLSADATPHTLDLNQTGAAQLVAALKTGTDGARCEWKQISGPSQATLETPKAFSTQARMDAIGLYVFEARITTRSGTAMATTYVNAWQPGAIVVNPGSSRLAWLPGAALMFKGTSTAGPSAVARWSLVGGPGRVDFSSADALETSATFSAAGTYELQLEVKEGTRAGQGRAVVEVYPPEQDFGGYSKEELAMYTTDLGIALDPTGLEWSRIAPPPAPGIHPRILFNPEDVPDLRRRLQDGTSVGPEAMKRVREAASALQKNPEVAAMYASLAAGDITPYTVPRAPIGNFMGALKHECFRILIDDDAKAAVPAAAALATVAEYLGQVVLPNQRELLKKEDTRDWRILNGRIHGDTIPWCYDFLAPYMSEAQRATVRRMIVRATDQLPVMGVHVLPGYHANASNWLPLTSQGFLFSVLAIEGEEGSDPEAIRAFIAAVNRQSKTLGWPDGTLSEGGGKGWLGCEQYMAIAKRGNLLVAGETFRNHLRQFFLQCIVPEGYGFTMDEMNGGTAIKGQFADDFFVTKFLYPKDPLIDFVFRNAFSTKGEDPSAYRAPFVGGNILAAICAENFQSNVPWEEALAKQVAPNVPLSCWFPYRGLLVTRSNWSPDATRLYFQPRCSPGGHTNPDRNCFVLHALGRNWVPMDIYQSGSGPVPGDSSMPTSIVRIDDEGSGDSPSAEVDVFDSPRLTAATGDAKDAYRAVRGKREGALTEPISYTFNQKHGIQLPDGWANLPMGILPNWLTSQKQSMEWSILYPDARAFRTAALVRPQASGTNGEGPAAYVLIADDIQLDGTAHNYKWRMMLANDLRDRDTVEGNDVIYTAPDGKTCLLVRLLACSGKPTFLTKNKYKYFDCPWLDISVDTAAPDFRVLLYPFKAGTPLPKTTWKGQTLQIDHGGGRVDRIAFTKEKAGWTKIRMTEEGGR